MTDRRFIEESFPVKEVSAISAKEKNIRHGHICTLHIWWARRPLASSRATAYAALTPAAGDDIAEWQRRRDFIVELSKWENSLNPSILEKARHDILQAHAERLSAERGEPVTVEDIEASRAPRPRVLDPFSGGGAIPLEALRLGCETYASDYNPVAVLILKATLEYPQKFGQPVAQVDNLRHGSLDLKTERTVNPLLEAVKKWGNWVLEEARKELARFYPPDPDGSIPVGYIWARTIPCQNPACGAEIPLMRQFWLAKKTKTKRKKMVALYPEVADGRVEFRIVGDGSALSGAEGYDSWPEGFDPKAATVSRAVATCPVCGGMVQAKTTRHLFREGKAGQRMMAVVLKHPQRRGKTYRVATAEDVRVFREAEAALQSKRERLMLEWGMDPVPDELLPLMSGVFNVPLYGMTTWGSLFNARQQLALITFAEKVRQAHERMVAEGYKPEFARAVVTYLAITFNRLVDKNASLVVYNVVGEKVEHVFGRQALPMVWDYVEVNPFTDVGWPNMQDWVTRVIMHTSQVSLASRITPHVSHASTTQLPYPDAHFDAVLTDPPYYINVPYADLSDFFYVWLKRTVSHLYPDLFSTPLTPKSQEICQMQHWDPERYAGKTKEWFEKMLTKAFSEIHRVLKPGGVAVIVYAHKSTEGWETVVNALLDSGLVVSGAWPLHTERKGRLRARESATLASSIYIVVRKMARQPTGFYNEVREELRQHLNHKLHRLWEEGIGGADFFVAAIGSAIEVFGKYEQVMDYEGNIVRADRLLQDVRTIATDYAVRQILQDGFTGEVSDLTRLYVLWRWNYDEARVPFDEARKLAQSCGVDLAREWGRRGFVSKEREFVRLLGPQKRKLDDLEKDDTRELIDVLHRVLLLWEKGQREELVQVLATSSYGRSEAFYRVAQAVSETLPNESKEKKLLDGFLVGRERVREEVGKVARQERLL
jgi:adenine-specific DNA methylase